MKADPSPAPILRKETSDRRRLPPHIAQPRLVELDLAGEILAQLAHAAAADQHQVVLGHLLEGSPCPSASRPPGMPSSVPMENATADATAVAGRLQRARDELLSARDLLESLGKTAHTSRVAELGDKLEDLLRDLNPVAARAYPGSVEQ